jgi:hypothetical protein
MSIDNLMATSENPHEPTSSTAQPEAPAPQAQSGQGTVPTVTPGSVHVADSIRIESADGLRFRCLVNGK